MARRRTTLPLKGDRLLLVQSNKQRDVPPSPGYPKAASSPRGRYRAIHYFLLLAFCLLSSFACQRTFTDLDEYEQYIKGEDSPYVRTIVKNGVRFTLRYMPTDAMMLSDYRRFEGKCRQIEADTSLSATRKKAQIAELRQELEQIRSGYSNAIYFNLTIGYQDRSRDLIYASMANGFGNYSQWLRKLLFGLQEKITLHTELAGEIPLSMYHMERSYGLTKERTLLLTFPRDFNGIDVLHDSPVRLRLSEMGLGVGRLNFDFSEPKNKAQLKIE